MQLASFRLPPRPPALHPRIEHPPPWPLASDPVHRWAAPRGLTAGSEAAVLAPPRRVSTVCAPSSGPSPRQPSRNPESLLQLL